MLLQSVPHAMSQGNQDQLRALEPGEFHRWHEVAVGSHKEDDLALLLQGEAGDIQTDPNVDTLLGEIRLQSSAPIDTFGPGLRRSRSGVTAFPANNPEQR